MVNVLSYKGYSLDYDAEVDSYTISSDMYGAMYEFFQFNEQVEEFLKLVQNIEAIDFNKNHEKQDSMINTPPDGIMVPKGIQ